MLLPASSLESLDLEQTFLTICCLVQMLIGTDQHCLAWFMKRVESDYLQLSSEYHIGRRDIYFHTKYPPYSPNVSRVLLYQIEVCTYDILIFLVYRKFNSRDFRRKENSSSDTSQNGSACDFEMIPIPQPNIARARNQRVRTNASKKQR